MKSVIRAICLQLCSIRELLYPTWAAFVRGKCIRCPRESLILPSRVGNFSSVQIAPSAFAFCAFAPPRLMHNAALRRGKSETFCMRSSRHRLRGQKCHSRMMVCASGNDIRRECIGVRHAIEKYGNARETSVGEIRERVLFEVSDTALLFLKTDIE